MARSGTTLVACAMVGLYFAAQHPGHHHAKHHHGHHAASVQAVADQHLGGSNVAIGKRLAARRGWNSRNGQWSCLYALWNHESGWSNTAQNSHSTAYGIAQFLDTTWEVHGGGPKTSDPADQIRDGLDYIQGRYGTPCHAWSFEMSHTPNWY